MVTRKRIQAINNNVSGGGGGPAPAGTVEWGPDFGGVDGDHLDATGTIALTEIELIGALNEQSSVSSAEANLIYNAVNVNCSTVITEIELIGALNGTSQVASLTYETGQMLASKDCWVPTEKTLGNCDDVANHNAEDLRISSLGLLENIPVSLIAFNLTSFPNNATVTTAELILKPITTGLVAITYTISTIAAGDEGWTEAGVTCDNIPARAAPNLEYSQPSNTNEITINLTASFASYIAGRMGSANTCTFYLWEGNLIGTIVVYESKDEGTNNAQGPRLRLIFTVPVT